MKKIHFMFRLIILVLFYLSISLMLQHYPEATKMFSSPDAKEYLSVGNEFFHLSEVGYSETRPFLFPLVIKSINSIFGINGIWFIQFSFWLFSVNLIYYCILNFTSNKFLSTLGFILMGSNLSFLSLTYHALTEVSVIFILTVLLYYFSKSITKNDSLKSIFLFLVGFSILSVIKPLFFIPFIITGIIAIVFFGKEIFFKVKNILMVGLILLPIVLQVSVMKLKYGSFQVSRISTLTFKKYFVAELINNLNLEESDNVNWQKSVDQSMSLSNSEIVTLLAENKTKVVHQFAHNVYENLNGFPTFLSFPETNSNSSFLLSFMIGFNHVFFFIHLLFLPLLTIVIFNLIRERKTQKLLVYTSLLVIHLYIIFSSGISFWSGDRLLLIDIPIWLTLYAIALNDSARIFAGQKLVVIA